MRGRRPIHLAVLISMAIGLSCTSKPSRSAGVIAEIEEHRRVKDIAFREDADSPLPEAAKKDFTGLHYFPIALDYRFEGPIIRNAVPDTLTLAKSDGRSQKALRYGYFAFVLERRQLRIEVYRLPALPESYLFIPFMDASSGEETYGGGRYLDIAANSDNYYVIDFNLAYNPSCAYGRTDFSCPIPPRTNHLDVRIPAGEKKWKH